MRFKFCPLCAGGLREKSIGGEMTPVCSKCSFEFFQNSKPTAGALIEDGEGKILLMKRAEEPSKEKWDIIGGYLNNGEDPIDGLRRELREELQIEIEDVEFFDASPDSYIDPHGVKFFTLNLTYTCEIKSGRLRPNEEYSDLRWFSKDNAPYDEMGFAYQKNVLEKYFENV